MASPCAVTDTSHYLYRLRRLIFNFLKSRCPPRQSPTHLSYHVSLSPPAVNRITVRQTLLSDVPDHAMTWTWDAHVRPHMVTYISRSVAAMGTDLVSEPVRTYGFRSRFDTYKKGSRSFYLGPL